MTLPRVRVVGDQFVDEFGRQLILRGVNLGGDCKVAYPDGGTHHPGDFSDHRDVSFIGRPFPLEEADDHLGRLAHWGFNCLRLLTTWEAVEHAGPGEYDAPYLDYLAEVCRRAGDHGLYVFIDFHQDVWSRMTGGDGAPGWTFAAAGLDFTKFHDAGAAHVMQHAYDYASPAARQAAYPQMSWGSNHRLPATAIMWTLFWAGRTLTPLHRVGEENIQDYLQRHYLGAMDQVARRVRDMPHVLGFDTLNEPGTGWVGDRLSYRHLGPSAENPARARPGLAMSALDALAVARGLSTRVPVLKRNPETAIAEPAGERLVNPQGVTIWRDGVACPFEAAGAYRLVDGAVVALDEDFFRRQNGQTITVSDHGFGPFFDAVARTVRAHNPEWAIFAELDAFGAAAGRPFPAAMPERSVNASHWYDSATLYLKTFDPQNSFDFMTGERATSAEAVRERFIRQIAKKAAPAKGFSASGSPALIGEFGIPFDLDDGAAYTRWAAGERSPAIWDTHVTLLGLMYDALDALLLHSTQWNYTASNRNDLRIGDGWNQEDLSIYSPDQWEDPADPDSGGRAVEGFCRPFARQVQGQIRSMTFDRESRRFALDFEADPGIGMPTEIYVPRIQFPDGFSVAVEPSNAVEVASDGQLLRLRALRAGHLRVTVHSGAQLTPRLDRETVEVR